MPISKTHAAEILERAGIPEPTIKKVLEELPDPIDVDRDGAVLLRYGVTRDELMSRLGASP